MNESHLHQFHRALVVVMLGQFAISMDGHKITAEMERRRKWMEVGTKGYCFGVE